MAYHIHNTNNDMTSHTMLTCKSHANHNEETGRQDIIMNCIWLICMIAMYDSYVLSSH